MIINKEQTIAQTMNMVMEDLTKVGIGKNEEMKIGASYKFRKIDDIHNTLAPILSRHGLIILPKVIEQNSVMGKNNKGNNQEETHITVEYMFAHVHNAETLYCTTVGEAFDTSDKSIAKALSMAYKYMAIQAFSIPVVGNEDGDSYLPEVSTKHAELKVEIRKLMETCTKQTLLSWIEEKNAILSDDEVFLNNLKNKLLETQPKSEAA